MSKRSPREEISKNVVDLLKAERLNRKLSMTAVAEVAGLHVSHISLVERGQRKPTLDALLRIAEALEIDLWATLKESTDKAKCNKQ